MLEPRPRWKRASSARAQSENDYYFVTSILLREAHPMGPEYPAEEFDSLKKFHREYRWSQWPVMR
jgi:hypothetical protein